jgi:hypothetical protein
MIVRGFDEHSIAAEFIGSRKTILILSIQSCPSVSTIPFKMCRRRFPIKIAFAMTLSKAQGQMLKHVAIYPSSNSAGMGPEVTSDVNKMADVNKVT